MRKLLQQETRADARTCLYLKVRYVLLRIRASLNLLIASYTEIYGFKNIFQKMILVYCIYVLHHLVGLCKFEVTIHTNIPTLLKLHKG